MNVNEKWGERVITGIDFKVNFKSVVVCGLRSGSNLSLGLRLRLGWCGSNEKLNFSQGVCLAST